MIAEVTPMTVASIIRSARGSMKQAEFARALGVDQSAVSRYERGKGNPPAKVLNHCMRLLHQQTDSGTPSADELASKVLSNLADREHGAVRQALVALVDTLGNRNSQAHEMRQRPT